MRHLGSLEDETLALRFHDYMLARGMPTRVDREGNEWAVWIVEEDHAEPARAELEAFLAAPDEPKYVEAAKSAQHIRREQVKKEKQARRQVRHVGREWDARRRRGAVVTFWLTAASVVVTLTAVDWNDPLLGGGLFGMRFNMHGTTLLRASYIEQPSANISWPADHPTLPELLQQGQVWRVFTPMFIHLGPLHLLFNMMWLRQLGSAIEFRRGPWKYLAIVLLIAAASNLAQWYFKGPRFGGMSGVVFGLFGYVWMKSKYDPADGFFMPPNLVFFMLAWMVLCYTGGMGPIANTAHTVGLLAGCLLGYLPGYLRRLRRRAP